MLTETGRAFLTIAATFAFALIVGIVAYKVHFVGFHASDDYGTFWVGPVNVEFYGNPGITVGNKTILF